MDFRGKDVKDAAVVFLGRQRAQGRRRGHVSTPPHRPKPLRHRPTGRHRQHRCDAGPGRRVERRSRRARWRTRRGKAPRRRFHDAHRLDQPIAPDVSGTDAFFEFLFSRAPVATTSSKEGGRPGAAAVLPPRRRDAHVQRRRRLRGRPHAADPQHRRHRRRQRSAAEGHLRRLRRPLRSRRLRGRAAAPGTSVRRERPAASPPARATIASGTAPTTTDRGRWR